MRVKRIVGVGVDRASNEKILAKAARLKGVDLLVVAEQTTANASILFRTGFNEGK